MRKAMRKKRTKRISNSASLTNRKMELTARVTADSFLLFLLPLLLLPPLPAPPPPIS
ncbi:hypothetical protein TIFTF001_045242, partial [Ficus carica]